ncbi:MAG TPA: efflux RND transporter permease subunit [Bacteroidales bacterium]|nr:efflux RND transporter permease subunit [Bacteroidales bacterium]
MLKFFIDRPVFSSVISILLVILGFLGLERLPVTQYPDIAPPTVQVSASYPGANAETILESVIVPIEEQINGVEGMTYITSSASNTGRANIQVFFEQGYDADIAAVNVQNRVAAANSVLPAEVIRAGINTSKRLNTSLLYAAFYSTNPDYDDTFIQNYLNIHIKPELQRINGVGEVGAFGGKDYAMRVWLDPTKMANYGLVPTDVINAIGEQSLEAAAGALGQNAGESFEYVIKYKGRYKTSEEYEDIIIRALGDGRYLHVKDVATVQLDAFSYSTLSQTLGYPSISFGVNQTPGSNAQEIIENIHEKLLELRKDFPEGIDYVINYDTNRFLTASIDKVRNTLIEAFLLVFLVVFLFLQDFRSTLIPAIAVPVSIIGTFFFLGLFGYSINLLTLFALVLAIGIVVDDAIVVVEAVHAKLEGGATNSRDASVTAMNEIAGAIVSITLVMAAVFIPITFIKGPTGVFYEQFGVTLIIAILISAVNALTLSPALSAIFLKPQHELRQKKKFLRRFYEGFNAGFNAGKDKYARTLGFITRHRWIVPAVLIIAIGSVVLFDRALPKGFVPTEDRGIIFMNGELPLAASLDRSYEATQQLYDQIKDIEGINTLSLIAGRNFFSGAGSSYIMGFINLKNWDERGTKATSAEAIQGQLFRAASSISDAKIIFFTPSSIPGFGSVDGFEMQLLDRTSGSLKNLDATATAFTQELMQQPEIGFASDPFSTDYPQLQMEIDVARAKESGVSVSDILRTLQGYVGGYYTTNFSRFGKQYRVQVQALPENRMNTESLSSMFVKTRDGSMTPVSAFVTLQRIYGPQTVTRFNLFNSVAINGTSAPGYSSGDAINAIRRVAKQSLPNDYQVAFSGLTREEIAAQGQAILIFFLSIVFVYFLLAAQYESYLLPFSVILSLPIGVAGAYASTWVAGLENNIYFQIGLIMLVGLLAKNAILIVEFALQRRRHGMGIVEAAIEGATVRLRPILMTSFAFIFGMLPLVLASGVGAQGNRSIGTGAAGGLLVGTVIGILVVPTLFVAFQWLHEKLAKKPVVESVKNSAN